MYLVMRRPSGVVWMATGVIPSPEIEGMCSCIVVGIGGEGEGRCSVRSDYSPKLPHEIMAEPESAKGWGNPERQQSCLCRVRGGVRVAATSPPEPGDG